MLRLQLPRHVDPLKAAKRNLVVDGQVTVQDLSRLVELVKGIGEESLQRQVTAKIAFSLDQQQVVLISGQVEVILVLRCERCLHGFDFPVSVQFNLTPVEEESKQVPEAYEPILTSDDGIDLWGCIEDEILLSIPYFPMHEGGTCKTEAVDEDVCNDQAKDENPFAILKTIKRK